MNAKDLPALDMYAIVFLPEDGTGKDEDHPIKTITADWAMSLPPKYG